MKFTKKYREKIVKDYLGYKPKKISKKEQICPVFLQLQNECSKAVSFAFKNASNIVKRKFKI